MSGEELKAGGRHWSDPRARQMDIKRRLLKDLFEGKLLTNLDRKLKPGFYGLAATGCIYIYIKTL